MATEWQQCARPDCYQLFSPARSGANPKIYCSTRCGRVVRVRRFRARRHPSCPSCGQMIPEWLLDLLDDPRYRYGTGVTRVPSSVGGSKAA